MRIELKAKENLSQVKGDEVMPEEVIEYTFEKE